MSFKEINWQEADQQAYINTSVLEEKNKIVFDRLFGNDKEKKDAVLFQIYKIFSYLSDKGTSYTKASSEENRLIIFKEKTYGEPGNIVITTYRNFFQIECELARYTGNRDFIRLTITPEEAYVTGYIKEKEKPACTIKGAKQKETEFTLEIVDNEKRHKIEGDEPWHILSALAESVIGKKQYTELTTSKNKNDIWTKLYSILCSRGLQKHLEELNIHLCQLHTRRDIEYMQDEISMFFVTKALTSYVENIHFEDKIKHQEEKIRGIEADEEAINRFANYQISDKYTGETKKLTDIPLYLLDTAANSQCEFLDALNELPEKDIDIYVVGLAYFATYCTSFGEQSGRNFYGANIYPRYAGYKMATAVKSSVLGIPLADYARARYEKNGENYPEICILFKMLGFDFGEGEKNHQILECRPNEINTSLLKQLLPRFDFDPSTYGKRRF